MKTKTVLLTLVTAIFCISCANENEVTLPVTRSFECDVLVIGGGPAGCGAAICAARHGAETILAERNGMLGGAAASSLIAPFMTSTTTDGKEFIIRGIYEDLVNRLVAQGGAIHPLEAKTGSWTAYREKGHKGVTTFDTECLKRTLEQMCNEAGVNLMYHMLFIKASTKKGKITAAYFATKAGIWKVTAKQYIDCTGDADVAYSAGVPTVFGDGKGDIQAVSLFFTVRGVDKAKMDAHNAECIARGDYEGQWYMNEIKAAREAGEFPSWRAKIALYENIDGSYTVNMAQGDDVDATDPVQVTEAEISGRDQCDKIVKFLRKYVSGCENVTLVSTAPDLGVRESRRIEGVYTVTTEDAKNSVRYPDPIFCCSNSMDIHRKGAVEYVVRNTNEPFYIPYRSLLPLKVDNLLVAGRCASAERPVMAAIRVMPPCYAMGQAAGTAAALCIRQGIGPKELDGTGLADTLKKDGVYFPEE